MSLFSNKFYQKAERNDRECDIRKGREDGRRDGGSGGGESTSEQLSMVSSVTEVSEGKGWRRNNRAWHRERKLEGERFSMSLLPYGEQPGHSAAHTCTDGEVSSDRKRML